MSYQPGERVVLERTSDPHTLLRPGDEGIVDRYDAQLRVLEVIWDGGSRLSLLLGEGDRVRRIPAPDTASGWERVLDAMRAAGAAAGHDAAQWWAQHVLGGRAAGDVSATARHVLAGLDDGDPGVIDGLPLADRYVLDEDRDRHAEHAPTDAPGWEQLTAGQCDQTRWAWCDGFDDAAEAEAARQCRIVLHPGGDDRDVRHLHPDRVRLGGPGVFAGDWAWIPNGDGVLRIPVGFAGTLLDTWNGWAVFTCTRPVAEAIVADQQAARARYRQHLAADGIAGDAQRRMVDGSLTRLHFDGDVLVADDTRVHDDPDAVERIAPGPDGRYTVMGRVWTWTAVHPYDCDRIVGDLPAPPDHPPPEA
ncbi:DUF4314 domain-containing protein [Micromonospora sp. NBC_00362]|uniref:DUF4314 domain-containing protein n=1 Tax=Micromonospora sp. NBC_00362 TaxID=2975975 RepID=UPI00224E3036|nr:DUF4314 domain-containing protein [Micromonospora sp. NBC_00362]MCX5122009.1 DUF4314 domain-containing protein [Micromonospora sp. NBC_00362]